MKSIIFRIFFDIGCEYMVCVEYNFFRLLCCYCGVWFIVIEVNYWFVVYVLGGVVYFVYVCEVRE